MGQELAFLSAVELSRLFETKQASPVEVTKAVLEQIEDLNPVLNAFCWLDEEAALQSAKSSEQRWQTGEQKSPIDGIPTTVKDLSVTKGWPTRRGSLAISARGPWLEDSPSVARMREAGAVIVGKTTVPEMGAWHLTKTELCGVTRNPWNPLKSPGGSSGGAAASLAAGMGTLALASDASGSIRTPSSITGVFGLKTTFGVVPDYPQSYLGSTAVIGPMTRTVADSALCMSVISRPDARESYALQSNTGEFLSSIDRGIANLRIAYSPTLGYAEVDPEVGAIVADGVKILEQLGAHVELVEHVFDDSTEALEAIRVAGMANAFRVLGITEEDKARMMPRIVERAEKGARVGLMEYLVALELRENLGAKMRAFHERYDLLVTPTLSIAAVEADDAVPKDPRYRKIKVFSPFCPPFNMTKQPAASVPVGLTAEGLPVGMQVIGPLYGDALVLRACHAIEKARPFARPNLDAIRKFPVAAKIPKGIASMREAMELS